MSSYQAKKAADCNPMEGPWFDPMGRRPIRREAAVPAVEVVEVVEVDDDRVLIRTNNNT